MSRFAELVIEHLQRPRNVGRLPSPDRIGRTGSPERPPFMVFHFRIDGEQVADVRYQTYGCGPAIAAGSCLTELVKGRAISACLEITQDNLSSALGGVPPAKLWCVDLALAAMKDGLSGAARAGQEG